MTRIAVCAPATPITSEDAARVEEVAAEIPGVELHFHPQCFLESGHFAGSDAERLDAFVACASDPAFDGVWFARGGYGSNRIAADAVARLGEAPGKSFLGYSDMGYLLGALYKAGIGVPAHGPMPVDVRRLDGAEAVRRALNWFSDMTAGIEPSLNPWGDDAPAVAFNLMTLAAMCGTELMPDLSGHVVMVEEVSEHLYAVDRLFFHVTQHLTDIAGLRLGRVTDVPENDRHFGADAEEIARHWCDRSGIAFLGHADIGHDIANKIVPFGVAGKG